MHDTSLLLVSIREAVIPSLSWVGRCGRSVRDGQAPTLAHADTQQEVFTGFKQAKPALRRLGSTVKSKGRASLYREELPLRQL